MTGKKSVVLSMPNEAGMIMIGLLSDTHGLLRPEVLEAFRNVTGIIHVGDVGRPEILESLQELAPTVTVRGNVDTGAWAGQLPLSVIVKIENSRVFVYHGHEALELGACRRQLSGYRVRSLA